jgi:hypothetical protein
MLYVGFGVFSASSLGPIAFGSIKAQKYIMQDHMAEEAAYH